MPLTRSDNTARRHQETGLFSDFTITCKGHIFKVHKTVLYTQSQYFRTLLTGPFKVIPHLKNPLDEFSACMRNS